MASLSRSFKNTYATGPWGRLAPVPDAPPQWELLLRSLELTESQARLLLKISGSKKADRLRRWIEVHHRDRFVPPRFLTREQMERCRWD
jgi:hypothetical protein